MSIPTLPTRRIVFPLSIAPQLAQDTGEVHTLFAIAGQLSPSLDPFVMSVFCVGSEENEEVSTDMTISDSRVGDRSRSDQNDSTFGQDGAGSDPESGMDTDTDDDAQARGNDCPTRRLILGSCAHKQVRTRSVHSKAWLHWRSAQSRTLNNSIYFMENEVYKRIGS